MPKFRLSLLVLVVALGCTQPPVELPVAPEPTSALRAEAQRGSVPEEARVADYLLDVALDAENHRVSGTARILWRNRTETAVDELPFHLYMNAFRAEDSAWIRSSRGLEHRGDEQPGENWGYLDVHSVALLPGGRLLADAAEPSPAPAVPLPWREHEEPSTMTVDLPAPIGPGETAVVEIEFTTQLPQVVARTGYGDDFHAVAQWYPKLGVLEDDGQWDTHTFTYHDEFYADFGNYVVHLEVPEEMVVGASGIRTGETRAEGRKRLTYEAEMVHDFAWMGDPGFVEHSVEHRGIWIRQLLQPDRIGDAEAHMSAQIAAIDSYESRFGPYPWSTLTIIHPPKEARAARGMEYPTLFTTSDRAAIPHWVREHFFDERVTGVSTTIHEFGHQYFQGLLASPEHLQPWLDEGINTFSNHLARIDRHGQDPWAVNFLGHPLYADDGLRLMNRFRGFLDPLDQPASAFDPLVRSYQSVYMKTSAVFNTLRRLVGDEPFDRAFRLYCDRWRFRQPTGQDLEDTFREVLGDRVFLGTDEGQDVYLDLPAFFDQALRTNYPVDFRVERIRNLPLLGKTGWQRDENGELYEVKAGEEEGKTGSLAVLRTGPFVLPVELLVEFEDGTHESRLWDGVATSKVFSWPGRSIRRVTLDPKNKLVLEWRRLDNSAYPEEAEGQKDGLSQPLGQLSEALSLALLGGLG